MHLVSRDDEESRIRVDLHHLGVYVVELAQGRTCHGDERRRPGHEQVTRGTKHDPSHIAGAASHGASSNKTIQRAQSRLARLDHGYMVRVSMVTDMG